MPADNLGTKLLRKSTKDNIARQLRPRHGGNACPDPDPYVNPDPDPAPALYPEPGPDPDPDPDPDRGEREHRPTAASAS